ncbi:type II toxin-antitoxin system RatA family toxin [Sneathiella glossodoripedis]|uniref:type II toxin-antitoxin system RatA family toxin n=1 Tax=Sneathiella glossodoripedis TaxID=418853 RepID=UPI00046E6298|nr:type II toxin-antitoxin system RatA family toxin [Sneathiella glossodoripedis]
MPTHAEQRILPFTPRQLYDLVADVGSYPEFLPWCVGARIKEKTETRVLADLVIGYKMFRERFTSRVTLSPEQPRIDVEYMDGPFKYLNNHWIFMEHPDGCEIDFYVDFEFKSAILQKTIGLLFNEAVQRMIAAFEQRAHDLYGDPAN